MSIEEDKPKNYDLYSIRQASKMSGVSIRTINNYITNRKIEIVVVDSYRLIPEAEVDKMMLGHIYCEPKHKLEGYKTVTQAARVLGIEAQNLKRYVKHERIKNVKKWGMYFIPDAEITLWRKVDMPNPNSVEAFVNDCVTVQDAARKIGRSDSFVRALITDGNLESFEGYCRRYVTCDSIRRYIRSKNNDGGDVGGIDLEGML